MSEGASRLINQLETADSAEARAEAWHGYAAEHTEELQAEATEAGVAAHIGQPKDLIELANRHVARRATAAVVNRTTK